MVGIFGRYCWLSLYISAGIYSDDEAGTILFNFSLKYGENIASFRSPKTAVIATIFRGCEVRSNLAKIGSNLSGELAHKNGHSLL